MAALLFHMVVLYLDRPSQPFNGPCVLALEMLGEEHEHLPKPPTDHTTYSLGSIGGHNVVIAGLHQPGNNPAATVVT